MITEKREFEGRQLNHIVLDPKDISNVLVVLKNCKRVINKIPPWNNENSVNAVLGTVDWLHNLVENISKA